MNAGIFHETIETIDMKTGEAYMYMLLCKKFSSFVV